MIAKLLMMPADCIFCKIIKKTVPGVIKFENDEIIIFQDIKPVAKYHWLSVPKEHIKNVNSLTTVEHINLLDKMISEAKNTLESEGGDLNDLLLGFHLPPFNTVDHLHLHVISPASSMSFLHRAMFNPNLFYFATADYIKNKLRQLHPIAENINNKL